MEFRKVLVLRGPNIWARDTVLEAWVELGALAGACTSNARGFHERLTGWLPSLCAPRANLRETAPFAEGLVAGLPFDRVLARLAIELQNLAGAAVSFCHARATSEAGVSQVVFQYVDEALGRDCLETACKLCLAALEGSEFDAEGEIKRLSTLNYDIRFGPSTGAIVDAARRRCIPIRRLNSDSLVQLGWGARARRISTAETSNTGAIAEIVAQDKELTRDLLRQVGVPVPQGQPVKDAEDAWQVAQEIGGPVVVKPRYGNHGRGVATNLKTREQVMGAYALAAEETDNIVVEQFAPGDDYRVLVVGGKVVAAARREPAQVIGDGIKTIEQLVKDVNRDPRRSDDHATALTRIKLCPLALRTIDEQGFRPDSIPAPGVRVLIRRNANLSTGGTATDVTDRLHPDVIARSIEAASVIGLDIAGIDVVAMDISRPLEQQRAVVVEVNAGPGLRMHLEPSVGTKRPVGDAIIDALFAPGDNGRVPVVAVSGVNGKTTVIRLVAHMLTLAGRAVGMTNTDGIYIDGRRIEAGDCAGPRSAKAVLLNPKVEAAVLETARGGILREGLGFDLCDVGIVTNLGEGDHLGLSEVATVEQLARTKRTVIEAVAPWGAGVLKADDPHTAAMAAHCPGEVIFFARDAADPVLSAHRASGGKCVFVRDGMVVLAQNEDEMALIPVARVPMTLQGRIGFQVENVLAASASAWALGLPLAVVRDALLSFATDPKTTPGRFNVLHHAGATIIADYAHNTSALLALSDAIAQLPHERRSVVFTVAGDRRDEDIVRQGSLLADTFDHVVIYEDGCNRGRAEGQVLSLLREGIKHGRRVAEVQEVRGETLAVETALARLKPGDLLVVQLDRVDAMVGLIQRHIADNTVSDWSELDQLVHSVEAVSVGYSD